MRPWKYILLAVALLLAINALTGRRHQNTYTYPNLPAPIAREPVLVTTAGLGAEGLIVAKMCEQLNLDYDYHYQGTPADLADKESLILVLGVSPAGISSIYTTADDEKNRVLNLVDYAADRHIPIIVVHPGGMDRRGGLNDQLINAVVPLASYVLVAGDGDQDGLFTRLTRARNIPLTEVAGINELEVPLNSAFR
ncbi:DUF6305 family protein [Desulfotomaculum copahuensis]|nr:DUF6305 family protein [Desulfotomaculum copahuensis]